MSELFRTLPKVDVLVRSPVLAAFPHAVAVGAARQVLDEVREELRRGGLGAVPDLAPRVAARARLLTRGRLVPVINATGVVVHTNLGRAPWSESARAAAMQAMGYCDLELDRQTGERGGRLGGVSAQIRHLTGAEATLVVNNCAAAVLLGLTALAAGREVVVSRGQLVEIGGSFRVPDVIASGGARLREVGTTNRTRIADFEAAIGPETAMLLAVHPSNFRVVGFTEEPSRAELVALARATGTLAVEDLGSGNLVTGPSEPSVREVVESGVDLVFFSGDKLLGGPQAGLIVGRAELVGRLRRHPLYRALRVDKVILAALEATLGDHVAGRPTPVHAMVGLPADVLSDRAATLARALQTCGVGGEVVEAPSVVGGGARPGEDLPSFAVRVAADRPDELARALRTGDPAVVARVHDGALWFDARTLGDDQIDALTARVAAVVRGE